MAHKFEGSKYEETKDLDKAVLAKLIRADLKAKFPGIKLSVRLSRFAGGSSIDVVIQSMPAGMYVRNHDNRHPVTGMHQWMTDEAIEFTKAVRSVCDAYNFDNSEIETDYFNVRFYCDVSFASDLRNLESPAPRPALVKESEPNEAEECEARWSALLGR